MDKQQNPDQAQQQNKDFSDAESQQLLRRVRQAQLDHFRQDLSSPALSIHGYVELLQEHLHDADMREFDEDLQRIQHASDQLPPQVEQLITTLSKTNNRTQQQQAISPTRHDMRNSLGAITGYSEMILEDLSPDYEVCREYLHALIDESNALLNQLEHLFQTDHPSSRGGMLDVLNSLSSKDPTTTEQIITGDILVVDDNPSNQKLLVKQLQRQGHQAVGTTSGVEALSLMQQQKFDLLLLDLMMPDINGFQVLQTMRNSEDLRAIPVIMISGLQDSEGVIRCIETGAEDYLTKPVNPILLKARITACLERKRWHDREQAYLDELKKSYAFIRKVFGRYLSDEIVHQLLDESDGLTLGGGKQKVTIMMTDLRGFTTISQELAPEDSVRLLNNYLAPMTDIIMHYQGTVDEFIGDAILAIFGAPLTREDDGDRAVACAIAMQQAMADINLKNQREGLPTVAMGIGLNTGEVVVGNIGSEKRSKYGIVGHHVNLAARVESFTIGGQILASEYTLADLSTEISLGKSMQVDAKGIKDPIAVHEITGIGGSYQQYLNTTHNHFTPLQPPISAELFILSGKEVNKHSHPVLLLALNEEGAILNTDASLKDMCNCRLNLNEPEKLGLEADEQPEIYGKIILIEASERRENQYQISFTSMPAATKELLFSQFALAASDSNETHHE